MRWVKAYDINNAEVLVNLDHVRYAFYIKKQPHSSNSVLTLAMHNHENIPIIFSVFNENIPPVLEMMDIEG